MIGFLLLECGDLVLNSIQLLAEGSQESTDLLQSNGLSDGRSGWHDRRAIVAAVFVDHVSDDVAVAAEEVVRKPQIKGLFSLRGNTKEDHSRFHQPKGQQKCQQTHQKQTKTVIETNSGQHSHSGYRVYRRKPFLQITFLRNSSSSNPKLTGAQI